MTASPLPANTGASPDVAAMETMLNQCVSTATSELTRQMTIALTKRETDIPKVAAATSSSAEIPHPVFLQHMQAMQLHYAVRPGAVNANSGLYALPSIIVPAPSPPALDSVGAKAVDMQIQQTHNAALAWVTTHAVTLMNAAVEADRTKSTAAWIQKMNALRNATRAETDAMINAFYSRLSDLGKAHPAQRARILQVSNQGGSVLSTLSAGAQSTLDVVHSTLLKAFGVIASPVKAVAQTVGGWASGAIRSVGSVLSKLF